MPNSPSLSSILNSAGRSVGRSGLRIQRTRPSDVFRPVAFDIEPSGSDFVEDYEEQEVNFMTNTVSHAFRLDVDPTSILPHPFVVGTHKVGVEIELENINQEMPRSLLWKDKEDGSLRNNGHEYVFRRPLGGRDLLEALQEVDTYLHDKNADSSWRCSTHVHLDVRDMTATQIKFLLIAYTIYERLIFRCSGWHRFKNNFCPAFGFAQGQIMTLSKNWHLEGFDFLRTMAASWQKYSSLNLIPMRSQGSVEFRMSEAKRHKGQLLRLCNRLLALKELAMAWQGTEDDLIHHLMGVEPLEVFGHKGLPKGYVSVPDDQILGAKLAIDMIHHFKIKNKTALEIGQRFVQVRPANQWESLTEFARNYDVVINGLDFSLGAPQPSRMTIEQLYLLSSSVPMQIGWFIRTDEDYAVYESYRLARQQSN